MTSYLSVPNFEKWQHYKDRTPPWIKMHREVLHSYDFLKLPDETKAHLMLIWMLASQINNKIPNDAKFIQKQIGANKRVNIQILVDAGFLIDWAESASKQPAVIASAMLAERKQVAMRETEEETEEERKKKNNTKKDFVLPDWIPKRDWEDWLSARPKKATPRAMELAVSELVKLKAQGFDPQAVLQHCIMNGYQGIYPPKGNTHASTGKPSQSFDRPNKTQRLEAAVRRAAESGGFAPRPSCESAPRGNADAELSGAQNLRKGT